MVTIIVDYLKYYTGIIITINNTAAVAGGYKLSLSIFKLFTASTTSTRVKIKARTPSKSNESRDTRKLFFQTILALVSLNRAYSPLYPPIVKPELSFKSEFSKTKNGLKNCFTEKHSVFDFLKFKFYSLLDFNS